VLGKSRQHMATAALAVIVVLQGTDLDTQGMWGRQTSEKQIAIDPYSMAVGKYQHLALAPMQVLGVCGDPYQETYVYRFMLLAHRLHMTFNSGIFARVDSKKVRAACEAVNRSVDDGTLDKQTVYIASSDEIERFKRINAACGRWNGHWICVSRDSDTRFATFIETGKDISGGSLPPAG